MYCLFFRDCKQLKQKKKSIFSKVCLKREVEMRGLILGTVQKRRPTANCSKHVAPTPVSAVTTDTVIP